MPGRKDWRCTGPAAGPIHAATELFDTDSFDLTSYMFCYFIQDVTTSLFIGIDIGTSRSGYSVARGRFGQPEIPDKWPSELAHEPKARTALLYDIADPENPKSLAWGKAAEMR